MENFCQYSFTQIIFEVISSVDDVDRYSELQRIDKNLFVCFNNTFHLLFSFKNNSISKMHIRFQLNYCNKCSIDSTKFVTENFLSQAEPTLIQLRSETSHQYMNSFRNMVGGYHVKHGKCFNKEVQMNKKCGDSSSLFTSFNNDLCFGDQWGDRLFELNHLSSFFLKKIFIEIDISNDQNDENVTFQLFYKTDTNIFQWILFDEVSYSNDHQSVLLVIVQSLLNEEKQFKDSTVYHLKIQQKFNNLMNHGNKWKLKEIEIQTKNTPVEKIWISTTKLNLYLFERRIVNDKCVTAELTDYTKEKICGKSPTSEMNIFSKLSSSNNLNRFLLRTSNIFSLLYDKFEKNKSNNLTISFDIYLNQNGLPLNKLDIILLEFQLDDLKWKTLTSLYPRKHAIEKYRILINQQHFQKSNQFFRLRWILLHPMKLFKIKNLSIGGSSGRKIRRIGQLLSNDLYFPQISFMNENLRNVLVENFYKPLSSHQKRLVTKFIQFIHYQSLKFHLEFDDVCNSICDELNELRLKINIFMENHRKEAKFQIKEETFESDPSENCSLIVEFEYSIDSMSNEWKRNWNRLIIEIERYDDELNLLDIDLMSISNYYIEFIPIKRSKEFFVETILDNFYSIGRTELFNSTNINGQPLNSDFGKLNNLDVLNSYLREPQLNFGKENITVNRRTRFFVTKQLILTPNHILQFKLLFNVNDSRKECLSFEISINNEKFKRLHNFTSSTKWEMYSWNISSLINVQSDSIVQLRWREFSSTISSAEFAEWSLGKMLYTNKCKQKDLCSNLGFCAVDPIPLIGCFCSDSQVSVSRNNAFLDSGSSCYLNNVFPLPKKDEIWIEEKIIFNEQGYVIPKYSLFYSIWQLKEKEVALHFPIILNNPKYSIDQLQIKIKFTCNFGVKWIELESTVDYQRKTINLIVDTTICLQKIIRFHFR
ncbi:hypothetical protein SNEBB_001777 [Seison nebaliae]|nr:hypothetical protein SNEBB_001777 [Seison nebaliae]